MIHYEELERIDGLPEHDYHQSSGFDPGQWVTRSRLHDLAQSEHGAWLRHIAKEEQAQFNDSESTKIGNSIEAELLGEKTLYQPRPHQILCPELNDGDTLVEFNLRKKSHRAWRDTMLKNHGIEFMEDKALAKVAVMKRSFEATPECMYFVKRRTAQQVTVRGYAVSSAGRLPIQIRVDMVNDADHPFLADLKSTKGGPEKFMNAVEEYGYHFQDVMYSDVWAALTGERLPFYFPCVNNCYPFEGWAERLPTAVTDATRARLEKAIIRCTELQNNGWSDVKRGQVNEQGQFRTTHVPLWWLQKYDALDN